MAARGGRVGGKQAFAAPRPSASRAANTASNCASVTASVVAAKTKSASTPCASSAAPRQPWRSCAAIQRGWARRPRTRRAMSSAACALSAPPDGWRRGCRGPGRGQAVGRRREAADGVAAASPSRMSRSATSLTCTKASASATRRRNDGSASSRAAGAEGVRGAREVGAAEIGARRPCRRRAPDRRRPRRRSRARRRRRGASGFAAPPRRGERVPCVVLVERRDGAGRLVEEGELVREGVAERAGDARPSRRCGDGRAAAAGAISKPVTRVEAWSQVGRTPISASAWAMSSPPERSVGEAQRSMTMRRGQSPSSCRWRRSTSARGPLAEPGGGAGRDGARDRG